MNRTIPQNYEKTTLIDFLLNDETTVAVDSFRAPGFFPLSRMAQRNETMNQRCDRQIKLKNDAGSK